MKSQKKVAPKTSRPRAAKPAARPLPTPPAPPSVTPVQRQRMIESAAYYLAEKNGFSGDPAQYWLQAEQEVNARLGVK